MSRNKEISLGESRTVALKNVGKNLKASKKANPEDGQIPYLEWKKLQEIPKKATGPTLEGANLEELKKLRAFQKEKHHIPIILQ